MKKILPLFVLLSLLLGACSQPTDTGVGVQTASQTLSSVSMGGSQAYNSALSATPPSTDGETTTGTISDTSGTFTYSLKRVTNNHYVCEITFNQFVFEPGKTMTGSYHYELQSTTAGDISTLSAGFSGSLVLTGAKVSNLSFNTNQLLTSNSTTGKVTITLTGSITADGHTYTVNQSASN